MSLAGRWLRRLIGPPPSVERTLERRGIDLDLELPWLHEQIRAVATTVPMRAAGPTLLDNFTHETFEMRMAYRRSLAEPAVKAALYGKIAACMSLGLQVKPAKDEPLDHEVADFVYHALTRCDGGLPGLVWTILSGGLIDGFSVSEKVWRHEERGRFKDKVSLLHLKAKDTRFIQYQLDAYRNVVGVYAMRGNSGQKFSPSDFVLFRYQSLFESPFGLSDLRAVYRACEMLPRVFQKRLVFLDKLAGPYLHAKVTDPTMREQMKAQLAQARSFGFLVSTPGDEVEVLDLASRGTSEFLSAIEDLRKEIAIGISGAFLTMYTGGQGETRGSAKVQQDTVNLFIWVLATLVATCFQEQLVPDLVGPNYGSQVDYPTVTLEAPNPEAIVAELAIDESLHLLGLPLSREELYERTGRRPPKDPEDALQPPAAGPEGPGGGAGGESSPAAKLGNRATRFSANGNGWSPDQVATFTEPEDDALAAFAEKGRWITIGGQKGKDGKRHGGSPVYIENGRITKGHPGLTGKTIGALKDEPKAEPKTEAPTEPGRELTKEEKAKAKRSETSRKSQQTRREAKEAAEYNRAVWRKRARLAGHKPEALEQLAGDIKAHHDAFANERAELNQFARDHHMSNFATDLRPLPFRAGRGEDWTTFPHFDQTAEATAAAFPHHFRPESGEHGGVEDQLFDMMAAGEPKAMDPEDAYSQALESLGPAPERPAKKKKKPADEDFPFGHNVPDEDVVPFAEPLED